MAISWVDLGPLLLAVFVLVVVVIRKRDRIFGSQWNPFTLMATSLPGTNSAPNKYNLTPQVSDPELDQPRVYCFFGSQTGTAESYAKDVAAELSRHEFKIRVVDLEDFDPDEFRDEVEYAIFFMATYGEGDPPDNAIDFAAFLKKDPEEGGPAPDFASHCKFSCFGLGNRQYEHYNAMGKLVKGRMVDLGAMLVHPYGEGDDDQDIEDDFNEWKTGLVDNFRRHAGLGEEPEDESNTASEESGPLSDFVARYIPGPEDPAAARSRGRFVASLGSKISHDVDLSSRHLFQGTRAPVVVNRELRSKTLTAGGEGSTVHVEFDIAGTGLSYKTADNLTVLAENDGDQVRECARYLGLDLDQWFMLEPAKPETCSLKPLFPTPCTIETALKYYTDLNGAPTRSLLSKLAPFAGMPEHKARLKFLASKEGKHDFVAYITEPMMCVAEIFETFPSLKLGEENLGDFFAVMPRLKSRDFTIASSSNLNPSKIALTVGVIRSEKPGEPEGRIFNGVCSTFLQSLEPGTKGSALVFVKDSSFKLPSDPKVPIIMVGPGTGIAPMRAFIEERVFQRAKRRVPSGDTILFFGCRREDEDFIYKEELMEALASGALTKLHTAFSREQAEKVYVQHLMAREREAIWDYLDRQGAYLYVCGATTMGRDVAATVQRIVEDCGGLDAEGAKLYISDLQAKHRYVQELWS